MYSNYYKLYNQCQPSQNEIISNTKFLSPNSPAYYDFSQSSDIVFIDDLYNLIISLFFKRT